MFMIWLILWILVCRWFIRLVLLVRYVLFGVSLLSVFGIVLVCWKLKGFIVLFLLVCWLGVVWLFGFVLFVWFCEWLRWCLCKFCSGRGCYLCVCGFWCCWIVVFVVCLVWCGWVFFVLVCLVFLLLSRFVLVCSSCIESCCVLRRFVVWDGGVWVCLVFWWLWFLSCCRMYLVRGRIVCVCCWLVLCRCCIGCGCSFFWLIWCLGGYVGC